MQSRCAHIGQGQFGSNSRFKRIIQIQHHQARVRCDIGVVPTQRNMSRALQHIVLIPGDGALQEIIARFAISESVDIDHD